MNRSGLEGSSAVLSAVGSCFSITMTAANTTSISPSTPMKWALSMGRARRDGSPFPPAAGSAWGALGRSLGRFRRVAGLRSLTSITNMSASASSRWSAIVLGIFNSGHFSKNLTVKKTLSPKDFDMLVFVKFTFVILLYSKTSITKTLTKPRIVGGTVCNVRQYPFVVAIFGSANCGGTLVTLQWVLTAAHCINPREVDQMILRSGFHSASNLIQIRYVKKAVQHKKFSFKAMDRPVSPELRYDIGLIKTDKPFKKSPTLQVAQLPRVGFTRGCSKGTVFGTGAQHIIPYVKNWMSQPLHCIELHIVNKSVCSVTYYDSVLDDTIVCTMEEEKGKDACYGDSGGPLVCNRTLIGVVSYGLGCGNAGLSATYTKVESYLGFIRATMKADKIGASETIANGSERKEGNGKLLSVAVLTLFVSHCVYIFGKI